MSLKEKVQADLVAAMKAKDKQRLEALRAIKSQILLAETSGSDKAITQADEIAILKRLVKQRKESGDIFAKEGRKELAEKEFVEMAVIEEYLPQMLSDEEVEAEVKKIIQELGANSMKDMGKVMGAASKKFAGRADNKLVSSLVKQLLA